MYKMGGDGGLQEVFLIIFKFSALTMVNVRVILYLIGDPHGVRQRSVLGIGSG